MLAVIRTMQILEALSSQGALGVLDLSRSLQIHKADVSRILSSLESMGYVTQNTDDEKYIITFKFVAMSLMYRDRTSLLDVVHPVLIDIVKEINELVQFALVQEKEVIYIDKQDSEKPLRAASMLGQTAPLHATAAGKIWMSSLPEDEVKALMDKSGMPAITDNTITDLDVLLQELKHIKKQGYAIANEEINKTIVGLAVAVYDKAGQVRGSIVATVPAYEASQERLNELYRSCKEGANVLSERLQIFW